MFLVAATSFFEPRPVATATDANPRDPRIGVVLVLLGCIAQGVQYVFEEKVMAVDNAPPLVVIGCEGLWGTVLTVFLVYPVAYWLPGTDNGSFEDPWDSFKMIENSSTLKSLLIGFVVFVTIYNCMAVYVTKYLSAIWHAILDNFRPVTIWGADLLLFYVLMPGSGFGETWTPASWLQLGGLLVLFLGTAIYDGRLNTCDEEKEVDTPLPGYSAINTNEETTILKKRLSDNTPSSMKSPAMTRSPLIYRDGQKLRYGSIEKSSGYSSTGISMGAVTNKGKTGYNEI